MTHNKFTIIFLITGNVLFQRRWSVRHADPLFPLFWSRWYVNTDFSGKSKISEDRSKRILCVRQWANYVSEQSIQRGIDQNRVESIKNIMGGLEYTVRFIIGGWFFFSFFTDNQCNGFSLLLACRLETKDILAFFALRMPAPSLSALPVAKIFLLCRLAHALSFPPTSSRGKDILVLSHSAFPAPDHIVENPCFVSEEDKIDMQKTR